ncbi:MAG: YggS family pyridoxal phosphate-dependent enzyme [Anaerolineae bacterium]|nr:YggS family pyridoxal phosphate-dependent enzyme [Anaerolineae bacterium]
MDELVQRIKENLQYIYGRMERSLQASGRPPDAARLVVVTKSQPLDVVEAAILAGARHLGENYPEEALGKIRALEQYAEVSWHMIGHVQSRKARIVAENFSVLHSLDSLHLAEKLERCLAETDKSLPVLLECNVSGEESKFGFAAWDETKWEELTEIVSGILSHQHLEIRGLMTMPPLFEDPEKARPYFIKLRRLQEFLAKKFAEICWDELSMGTSIDFEIAIAEGATLVRVGQAILGPRPVHKL